MRRHGARPRKEGARHKNGHRRYEPSVDRGHEATLDHRALLVGRGNAASAAAAYPLGVLYLRHLLSDPLPAIDDPRALERAAEDADRDNQLRHAAGWIYRYLHDRLWGSRAASSNMGNLAGARAALTGSPALLRQIEALSARDSAKLGRAYQERLRAIAAPGDIYARSLVDCLILDEQWPRRWLDGEVPDFGRAVGDLPALRRVLQRWAEIRD